MRIHSNTLLSWKQSLQVFQMARIHPEKWHNYHFYNITNIYPLIITSDSSIELLENNYQYYYYNKYHRDIKNEMLGNTLETCLIYNNQNKKYQKHSIYIPKITKINDIIAIHNIIHTPSTYNDYIPNDCLSSDYLFNDYTPKRSSIILQ